MLVSVWNPRSSIAKEFTKIGGEQGWQMVGGPSFKADIHLICSGVLHGEKVGELTEAESAETWKENFTRIAAFCDGLFAMNRSARVCIVGSHSADKGSYDMAYAGAKAAMHLYIKTKRLNARGQQLVGISPSIIWDSGMTQRRDDLDQLAERAENSRRQQFIQAAEVAHLAYFLLFGDTGSICNTVISQTGGIE